jgi:hypothetical protein
VATSPPARADRDSTVVASTKGKAEIKGLALDIREAPVTGAKVSVYRWSDVVVAAGSYEFGWSVGLPPPLATAVSDAQARFEFRGLDRGQYVLKSETPDGGLGLVMATAIDLGAPRIRVPVLAPAAKLRGVAVDVDARPLAAAPVVATVLDYYPSPAALLQMTLNRRDTVTDAEGRFELEVPQEDVLVAVQRRRDGRWTALRVGARGTRPTALLTFRFEGGKLFSARVSGMSSGRAIETAQAFVVSAGAENAPMTFQRLPAGYDGSIAAADFPALGNRGGVAVWAAPIGGEWVDGSPTDGRIGVRRGISVVGNVRDAKGTPVPGVVVVVHAASWPARRVVTDANGAYEVHGLPRTRPWHADPAFQGNGLVETWVEASGWVGEPEEDRRNVPASVVRIERDFVLRRGATIRGKVEAPAVRDQVKWAARGFAPNSDLLSLRGTGIGEDGSFVLTDLPPGRIVLKIGADRFVAVEDLKEGENREGINIPTPK